MKLKYIIVVTIAFSNQLFAEDDFNEVLKRAGKLVANTMEMRAEVWKCVPKTSWFCNLDGCKKIKPSVYTILNFKTETYSRCSSSTCDEHSLYARAGGMYTVAEVPGSGAFLKSLNNGESYVEALATGVSIIQNFGSCTPIN